MMYTIYISQRSWAWCWITERGLNRQDDFDDESKGTVKIQVQLGLSYLCSKLSISIMLYDKEAKRLPSVKNWAEEQRSLCSYTITLALV